MSLCTIAYVYLLGIARNSWPSYLIEHSLCVQVAIVKMIAFNDPSSKVAKCASMGGPCHLTEKSLVPPSQLQDGLPVVCALHVSFSRSVGRRSLQLAFCIASANPGALCAMLVSVFLTPFGVFGFPIESIQTGLDICSGKHTLNLCVSCFGRGPFSGLFTGKSAGRQPVWGVCHFVTNLKLAQ